MSKTVAYQKKSKYSVAYEKTQLTLFIVWTAEAGRTRTGEVEAGNEQSESAERGQKRLRSGECNCSTLASLTICTDLTFIETHLPPHQPAASKSKPSKTARPDTSKPPRPRQKFPAIRPSSPNTPPPTTTREGTSVQNEKTNGVPSTPPPSKPQRTSRPRQKSPAGRASSPDLPSPRTAMREAVSARSMKKGTHLMPPPSSTIHTNPPNPPSPRATTRKAISAQDIKKKGSSSMRPPSQPVAHPGAAAASKQVSSHRIS